MKQTDSLTDRGNPAYGYEDLNDNHCGIIIPHHMSELPHIKPSIFFSAQESAVNRCTEMDHLYSALTNGVSHSVATHLFLCSTSNVGL